MGTAEMDGVDTVTQCPIIPGNQFTYKFPVKDPLKSQNLNPTSMGSKHSEIPEQALLVQQGYHPDFLNKREAELYPE